MGMPPTERARNRKQDIHVCTLYANTRTNQIWGSTQLFCTRRKVVRRVWVNHRNDNKGFLTCDYVRANDKCLRDRECVRTSACRGKRGVQPRRVRRKPYICGVEHKRENVRFKGTVYYGAYEKAPCTGKGDYTTFRQIFSKKWKGGKGYAKKTSKGSLKCNNRTFGD